MITDTSQYVERFGNYYYAEKVAKVKEDLPTKLSLTNAAGRNGKRIGENYQDIKRVIVSGQVEELFTGTNAEVPLRKVLNDFRAGHRAELGKQRLYMHTAADGRPAEFLYAAVEAITGIEWDSPLTETEFEISFVAEPEYFYDLLTTVDLRQNSGGAGGNATYTVPVTYRGPDNDFYANAEGLPFIALTVTGITSAILDNTGDPPYIDIKNTSDAQTFRLYPQSNDTFLIDSYEEGIRKGADWDTGTIYEFADYDQFVYLVGASTAGGVTQSVSLTCHNCNVSAATLKYYPRHW